MTHADSSASDSLAAQEQAANLLSQTSHLEPARCQAVFQAYLDSWRARDIDARAALMATDVSIADPVGAPVLQGIAAARQFWEGAQAGGAEFDPRLELFIPAGNEALVRFVMSIATPGQPVITLTIHEVVTFDEALKITSIKAYWNESSMVIAG